METQLRSPFWTTAAPRLIAFFRTFAPYRAHPWILCACTSMCLCHNQTPSFPKRIATFYEIDITRGGLCLDIITELHVFEQYEHYG